MVMRKLPKGVPGACQESVNFTVNHPTALIRFSSGVGWPGRCYAFELGLFPSHSPLPGLLRSPISSRQSLICYGGVPDYLPLHSDPSPGLPGWLIRVVPVIFRQR